MEMVTVWYLRLACAALEMNPLKQTIVMMQTQCTSMNMERTDGLGLDGESTYHIAGEICYGLVLDSIPNRNGSSSKT